MEVLIFKALSDLYTSHGKFISINNVLKEYDEIRKSKSETLRKNKYD